MLSWTLRSIAKRLFFFGLNFLYPTGRESICPILLYHSVDDSGALPALSPSCFFSQMKYLKDQGYRTLTLSEYCQALRANRSLHPRVVVLTFDDGFENNYSVAFPILQELGFRATIFLATDYVGTRCNWERSVDIPKLPLMSWDQIDEMSRRGIEFGSHGATHSRLTRLPFEKARNEIIRSKTTMEKRLKREILSFCYPYGDYDTGIVKLVREAGFAWACSSIFGYNNGPKNLFTLQRMNINCTAQVDDVTRMLVFKTCLSGSATHFIRLRDRLSFLKAKPIPVVDQ